MKSFFDLTIPNADTMNYRWLQPPQIAYFVSTIDEYGNPNLTPVTLGTLNCTQYSRDGKPGSNYFSFSMGCKDLDDEGNVVKLRQGFLNLQKNKQCVISYIGYNVMRESIICNMPLPHGISEFDVAGLTPVNSEKVEPYSIKECPVNMECEVVHTYNMDGYYQFFICKVVGVSVDNKYIQEDATNGYRGVYAIDPLFEVQIDKTENGNSRLCYGRMDSEKLHFPGDDFGCLGDWVGSFEKWIADEHIRGKISEETKSHILSLGAKWSANRDEKSNGEVKKELTKLLKDICAEI